MNVIINHLVITKAQIQRICSWILSATESLVPPQDARGGKNTVCVPEQDLVWLLGVAGFMKILVCLQRWVALQKLRAQVRCRISGLPWDPHVFLGSASHLAPEFGTAVLQWSCPHLSQTYVPWWLLRRKLPHKWQLLTPALTLVHCLLILMKHCWMLLYSTCLYYCTHVYKMPGYTLQQFTCAPYSCSGNISLLFFFFPLLLWYNLKMWHPAMLLEIKFLIMNFLAFVSLPQILNIFNVIFMRISMLF